MSKSCKLVDLSGEGTSQIASNSKSLAITNWQICALCQKETNERLVDPGKTLLRGADKTCGYKLVAENLLNLVFELW